MKLSTAIGATAAAVTLSGCGFADYLGATRAYNYAVIQHVSSGGKGGAFEENTPGIGIGSEAPFKSSKYAAGVEAGVYNNPEDVRAPYAVAYVERDMLENRPRRLRFGAFAGFAKFPTKADDSNLAFGDYVLTGGLQMTVSTVGPHEFRVRMSPGLNDSGSTLTLSSNIKF